MWNKYGNKKVTTAEGTFDSKGEYARWLYLKDAERRGEIRDLRRQVRFSLVPPVHYTKTVHLKTKDIKGMHNDRWPIKKALMAFVHGIYVREVKRPAEPITTQDNG